MLRYSSIVISAVFFAACGDATAKQQDLPATFKPPASFADWAQFLSLATT